MKVKETFVNVSVPYQKDKFMYGRIELAELIVLDDGEDVQKIRDESFNRLLIEATNKAHEAVSAYYLAPNEEIDQKPETPVAVPRRRLF